MCDIILYETVIITMLYRPLETNRLQDPINEKILQYGFKIQPFNENNPSSNFGWAYPTYFNRINLPKQGFKLHISATIINSSDIFDKIIPYLISKNIAFKIAASNLCLRKLNSNHFSYSQVGKFITIYPLSTEHALNLAEDIHERLKEFHGPKIPSDLQYQENSVVHYRYGCFYPDKKGILVSPSGEEFEDQRDPQKPIPDWIKNPFPIQNNKEDKESKLLADRYLLLKVISQRSKGGVFYALDLYDHVLKNPNPQTKQVILKEGRKHSEVEENGIDAYARIQWEYKILKRIQPLEIAPKPIELHEFNSGALLTMDFCGGKTLTEILLSQHPDQNQTLDYLRQTAQHIKNLHKNRIYFFDLSPSNILISEQNKVKLIDFEFCVTDNGLEPLNWSAGTPGFRPNTSKFVKEIKTIEELAIRRDIYALAMLSLAVTQPKWYRDMIDKKYNSIPDWGMSDYINLLPKPIQNILHNTRPEDFRFDSVNQIIQEIEQLQLVKINETNL